MNEDFAVLIDLDNRKHLSFGLAGSGVRLDPSKYLVQQANDKTILWFEGIPAGDAIKVVVK